MLDPEGNKEHNHLMTQTYPNKKVFTSQRCSVGPT